MGEKIRGGEIGLILMFKNMLLQFFFKILNDGDWVTALLNEFNILTPWTLILLVLTFKIMLNLMYFVSCSGIVMMDFVIDSEEITKLTWKKIMK